MPPLTHPLQQVMVTKEQLTRITDLAYTQGITDVLAILRNPKTMGAAGEMIAQALEEFFDGEPT